MRHAARIAACFLGLLLTVSAQDAGPGTKIDALTVGPTTYHQVQVRSVNARTVMITHSGGMASIRLRDLAPEWQTRFHYDPAAEAAADAAAKAAPPPVAMRPAKPAPRAAVSKVDALLQKFGQTAVVLPQVDLRPQFFQLELGVKNQGRRPSCAVFAVVSALEFQNAELTGKVEKFSEEYLIWAVSKTVQRTAAPGAAVAMQDDEDAGFALSEVVEALRAYGIPLQASMPNTFGRHIVGIEVPQPAVVQEARTHQHVFVHQLPGRDAVTRVNNLILALNAGFPVPVGMAWPATRVVHGFISTQKGSPNSGHAVTMVGYLASTDRIEDTVFIFKNSWGPNWGQGGYGTVSYAYLSQYLDTAVLLEVQPPSTP